ncbi:MAG TPA: hypothetical protein VG365_07250 [Solirubrobacteraceae bacterium]|nr:hypothetical protein [Solirubrobacteraceae bacterium]
MSSVFVTGSAEGLGQLAARQLVAGGHEVVLQARGRDAPEGCVGRRRSPDRRPLQHRADAAARRGGKRRRAL